MEEKSKKYELDLEDVYKKRISREITGWVLIYLILLFIALFIREKDANAFRSAMIWLTGIYVVCLIFGALGTRMRKSRIRKIKVMPTKICIINIFGKTKEYTKSKVTYETYKKYTKHGFLNCLELRYKSRLIYYTDDRINRTMGEIDVIRNFVDDIVDDEKILNYYDKSKKEKCICEQNYAKFDRRFCLSLIVVLFVFLFIGILYSDYSYTSTIFWTSVYVFIGVRMYMIATKNQKIYYKENENGFVVANGSVEKYYKFSELDGYISKRYIPIIGSKYRVRIYKDKKILAEFYDTYNHFNYFSEVLKENSEEVFGLWLKKSIEKLDKR